MAIGNMFGAVDGTYFTRLVTAGEGEGAKKIAGYSFYGSIIAVLILAVVSYFTLTPLDHLLGGDIPQVKG